MPARLLCELSILWQYALHVILIFLWLIFDHTGRKQMTTLSQSYVNTTFLYRANLASYINSTILWRFNRKITKYRFWVIFGNFIELICEREWSRNNKEYLFQKVGKKFTMSTINITLNSIQRCQSFSNILSYSFLWFTTLQAPPPQKNRMVANNYNTITLNKIYHCSTGVSQTLVNSLTHLKGKVSFKFFGK